MARFYINDSGMVRAGNLLVPGSWDDVMAKWYFAKEHYKEVKNMGGMPSCAFCQKFCFDRDDKDKDCESCPIFEKTHRRYCHRTPNERLENYFVANRYDINPKKVLAYINREIAFLEAIRSEREE